MGNDVLSAGFFLMIMGSFYTFFKDLFVRYYYEIQSWFYVSVEVQEGDDTYKWLSGMLSISICLSHPKLFLHFHLYPSFFVLSGLRHSIVLLFFLQRQ